MAKLPSFQFYPGDWRKDPSVQSLSFHERGVWFELLCFMHESERRGVLLLNGTKPDDERIARLLGLDVKQTRLLLELFVREGVADLDPHTGALRNRRMVRDEKRRRVLSEAGRKGAARKALKYTETLKGRLKGTLKGGSTEVEAEGEAESRTRKGRGKRGEGKPARKVRARCPIWDKLAELFYATGVPSTRESYLGLVVAELKKKGVTADEIESRKARYMQDWPKISCTPKALLDHWDEFAPTARNPLFPEPQKGVDEQ